MTSDSAASGLRSVLVATAVAGVLGYAIQLLAPALLNSDASYVTFSVFWSTLYLCIATLSGVQQEVTRASAPVTDQPPSPVLRQFTFIAIAVVLIAVAVLASLFGSKILPTSTGLLAGALAVGVVGYLLVAILSGVLYGLRRWTAVAALIILDALLRAILVISALLAGLAPEWVALAISAPFGLAFLAVWMRTRSSVVGAFRLDVPLRRLIANASGTVTAAAAMGVMMNSLPMLLGLTASDTDPALLAGLILAITLTRAPIVIPLLALQSYFISVFRGGGPAVLRRILLYLCVGIGAVAILSGLAWAVGQWVIEVLSTGRYEIAPVMMAAITAGGGLVALMCVTGPALVSDNRHVPYVAGWVVAALLTVGLLLLPLGLSERLALALLVPPAVGLAIHIVAIVRRSAHRADLP